MVFGCVFDLSLGGCVGGLFLFFVVFLVFCGGVFVVIRLLRLLLMVLIFVLFSVLFLLLELLLLLKMGFFFGGVGLFVVGFLVKLSLKVIGLFIVVLGFCMLGCKE